MPVSATSASRNPGVPYTVSIRSQIIDSSSATNSADIYCPLAGCRCLILRKGHAQLVEREAGPLYHASAKPSAAVEQAMIEIKSEKATVNALTECWLVTSAMTFENIGFTKGVLSSTSQRHGGESCAEEKQDTGYSIPEGSSIRFLACADCDCGPIGWHIEGKGSDLGRDVEQDIAAQLAPQSQQRQHQLREFLIPIDRCRYKVD